MRRTSSTWLALGLTVPLIGLGGVGGTALVGSPDRAAAAKPALKRFGSCAAVAEYVRRHAENNLPPLPMAAEDVVLDGGQPARAQAPVSSGELGADDSQTNVQEAGIDEPDIVKSNGATLFAIANGRLYAVDATGPVPTVLGSLRLSPGRGEHPDAYGEQLLLAGDRALVISNAYADSPPWERTILTEVDVSDPVAMRPIRTMRVDGSFITARLAAQTARVVVSAAPGLPLIPEATGMQALQRGQGATRPGWMPKAVTRDRETGTVDRRRLVPCNDVGRPRRFAGVGLLTVLTIDLARGLPAIDTDAVMTSGETVYASPDALYVATQRWLGADMAAERVSEVSTLIHKFDTSSPRATDYRASGRVPGFMLSQWSMSERDGLLRVASTTSPPWNGTDPAGESESYVTVLGEAGNALREVGRLGGLGRGERIYAVRFFDDIGFVVTFRQIDPLYAIDLSDPARPHKLGELKIPGYSAYLHPVSDDLLLGIGQDADRKGVTRGVTASLFDVTSLSDPIRVDRWRAGRGTHTEVEYDHHSFLHWPPAKLAVLPVEAWGYDAPRFVGAVGLRVEIGEDGTPVGIGELGRVSHGRSWDAAIRRAVVVDGRLLAISARAVSVHDPETLAELGRASLGG
jgi:uncharacterized secreted protein with C-terminal beta-propeller domain